MGIGSTLARALDGDVVSLGIPVNEIESDARRLVIDDARTLKPHSTGVDLERRLRQALSLGAGTTGTSNRQVGDDRSLIIGVIGAVVLVDLQAAVHAIFDGYSTHYRPGGDPIVIVAHIDPTIALLDV